MLKFFEPMIDRIAESYLHLQDQHEISVDQIQNLAELVEQTLDHPDEVWMLPKHNGDLAEVFSFIKFYEPLQGYHVVFCHVTIEDEPAFIYFQFFCNLPVSNRLNASRNSRS